ncbi:hypothetical protein V2W45_1326542 [Cenococcum geophilum]
MQRGKERPITYQYLNGYVQDIFAIENYLQSVGPCDITKLTASNGGDKPTEDESAWPTYNNIINELKRIKDAASPGDLVAYGCFNWGSLSHGVLTWSLDQEYSRSYFSRQGMRDIASFAVRTSMDQFNNSMLLSNKTANATAKAADTANTTNIPPKPGHRNAAVRQSWLLNPVSCTILTAYGVNKTAGE